MRQESPTWPRPCEEFFDLEDVHVHRYLRAFCRYLAEEFGYGEEKVRLAVSPTYVGLTGAA